MQTVLELCLSLEPKQLIEVHSYGSDLFFRGHVDEIIWNEKDLHELQVDEVLSKGRVILTHTFNK